MSETYTISEWLTEFTTNPHTMLKQLRMIDRDRNKQITPKEMARFIRRHGDQFTQRFGDSEERTANQWLDEACAALGTMENQFLPLAEEAKQRAAKAHDPAVQQEFLARTEALVPQLLRESAITNGRIVWAAVAQTALKEAKQYGQNWDELPKQTHKLLGDRDTYRALQRYSYTDEEVVTLPALCPNAPKPGGRSGPG